MATSTRKPASFPSGAPRRPALRASADTAPESLSGPSTSISTDDAAYIVGREAGYRDGSREGAERERARLNSEESLDERIKRMLSRAMYPRTHLAIDYITSWMLYAFGASVVVGFAVLVWRILKWI